jgi:glutamate N-acetyltransferase / amino-acid N-acetyltransferase
MTDTIKQIRVCAFPLEDNLEGEYKISDHLNLCGKAIKDLGFIPISDLYLDKANPDAIKVACLKEGVEPTDDEKAILLKHGIKAYSYELIEPALRAASRSQTVEATLYFPKLPKGFSLETRACKIKGSGSYDFGIIRSSNEAIWAGTFTQNKARAFCVEENIASLDSKIKVIACNSGNANACTGEAGKKADLKLRSYFSKDTKKVLLASTGKIGVTLPVEKILDVIARGEAPQQSIKAFAQAILTTDTCIKISQDSKQNFLGFAKGSGMIHPNMATMLAFVLTDKKIKGLNEAQTKSFMQEILSVAVSKSFNSISVDGDTSTNDMCILMNNCHCEEHSDAAISGSSHCEERSDAAISGSSHCEEHSDAAISQEEFAEGLRQVCSELAYKIIADGEGLTKISKLVIKADFDSRELGRFILNSLLVKTAFHGNDPNWGRIISSLGQYASQNDLDIDINKVKLSILGTSVFEKGLNTQFDRTELIQKMKQAFEIELELDLGGKQTSTVFGNDLTNDYIRINAEYFT